MKKYIVIVLYFLANSVATAQVMLPAYQGVFSKPVANVNSIITSGLVLNLDASNAASYPGSGTVWTDLSGLNNNGTLINSPTYNSSNGGNLVFNGSTSYVSAPLTKAASCTFSVWAKTSTAHSSNMLFNAGNNGTGPDLFFMVEDYFGILGMPKVILLD